MEQSASGVYKDAGVDITAGYRAVELMKSHAARTRTPGVLGGLGGFGGMFRPDLSGIKEPVLVSGTDGVGTKIKLAFLLKRYDTVGIDCVAMCVNDIVCSGARPLFFLDYIACGRNIPERTAQIVAGAAEGCVWAGCALIGGETAEHPGLMPEDEFDLAGFAVGIADKSELIGSDEMREGDAIIALPSSGAHSNGFSLVHKIFGESALKGPLGAELLTPTRIYVKPVLALMKEVRPRGVAHITGGGFYENVPRIMRPGLGAVIEKAAVRTPPVFERIMEAGSVPERDMWNIFNMGVGMVVVVSPADASRALDILRANGEQAYVIGETARGEGITLC